MGQQRDPSDKRGIGFGYGQENEEIIINSKIQEGRVEENSKKHTYSSSYTFEVTDKATDQHGWEKWGSKKTTSQRPPYQGNSTNIIYPNIFHGYYYN